MLDKALGEDGMKGRRGACRGEGSEGDQLEDALWGWQILNLRPAAERPWVRHQTLSPLHGASSTAWQGGGGVQTCCTEWVRNRRSFLVPFPTKTWKGMSRREGHQDVVL